MRIRIPSEYQYLECNAACSSLPFFSKKNVEPGKYAAPTIQDLAKDDIKSNEEECYKTKTFEDADRVRFLNKAD